ncbi:hypothetical protein HU200_043699 [Digitaria exilis]|uniref:C2H2-type domain-containing protein n=1 Tax=Digitaria exilis TaxID=1010633 RepID=A0A835B2Q7_9POAL|nr:hypothetical protein HU200_043699 [Digitaria exilis]
MALRSPLLRVDLTAVFSGACGRCQERHHDLERWVESLGAPFPAEQARAWSEARACDGPLLAYGARPTSLGPDKFDARPVLVEINKQRRNFCAILARTKVCNCVPLPAGIDPLKTEQPPQAATTAADIERVLHIRRHLPHLLPPLQTATSTSLLLNSVPRHGRHSPTPAASPPPPRPPPLLRRLTSTRTLTLALALRLPHSLRDLSSAAASAEAAGKTASPPPLPPPRSPGCVRLRRVTRRRCTECDKPFKSWKALFGHMRCHPERQWPSSRTSTSRRRSATSPRAFSCSPANPNITTRRVGKGKKKTKSLPRDEPLQRAVVEHYHYFAAEARLRSGVAHGQALGGHKRCHWEMACGERMEVAAAHKRCRALATSSEVAAAAAAAAITVEMDLNLPPPGTTPLLLSSDEDGSLERVAGVEAWY